MSPQAEFLEKHKNADVIVYDPETREVVAAEYTTCQGRPRRFPVRFDFEGSAIDLVKMTETAIDRGREKLFEAEELTLP